MEPIAPPGNPLGAPPRPPAPPAKVPGQALGITALIFASLFFIPFLPIVGLVLGIIALVVAPAGKKTLGIVAVCVAPVSFFFLQGIVAAIAIPSFMKYIRRSKTVEATSNVNRLAQAVLAFHADNGRWPPSSSGWVPAQTPCGQPNDRYPMPSPPGQWQASPWRELQFSIVDRHYYQYRVVNEGERVVVEAQGDLDCDQELSHFEREVDANGVGPLHTQRELE